MRCSGREDQMPELATLQKHPVDSAVLYLPAVSTT